MHDMQSIHESYANQCFMVYVFMYALFTYVWATCGLTRVCGNRGDELKPKDA
jgi:hypothetical protein